MNTNQLQHIKPRKWPALAAQGLLWASLTGFAHAGWQWSDQAETLGPTGSEPTMAFPQVAVEPVSGIATAAWVDTTTFMLETVQAIRFRDGKWEDRQSISQNSGPVRPGSIDLPPVRGVAPQIVAGKNGNATVAWTSLLPDQYGLASAMWKKTKNRWLDPTFTAIENRGLGDVPQIHNGQNQNGNVTAVWRGTATDGGNLIQTSRFTNGKWGKPKTLFQSNNSLSEPQLAVCKNGTAMVVWTQYYKGTYLTLEAIKGRLFSGGKWGRIIDVGGWGNVRSPSIVCNRPGFFSIVWREYHDKDFTVPMSFVVERHYDKGRASQISIVGSMQGDNMYNPIIATSASGNASTVVYGVKLLYEDGSIENALMASRKEALEWTKPVYIGLSGQRASTPLVAMDEEGNTTVVWEEVGTLSGQWRVRTTRYSLGRWGSEVMQAYLCKDCSSPSLAVDPQGKAWAVWVANGQVQAKRGAAVE